MRKTLNIVILSILGLIFTNFMVSIASAELNRSTDYNYKREYTGNTLTEFMSSIQGNWYDADGNEVLHINGIYVNGCLVEKVSHAGPGAPDMGYMYLREATGVRPIFFTRIRVLNNVAQLGIDRKIALFNKKHYWSE